MFKLENGKIKEERENLFDDSSQSDKGNSKTRDELVFLGLNNQWDVSRYTPNALDNENR